MVDFTVLGYSLGGKNGEGCSQRELTKEAGEAPERRKEEAKESSDTR